MGGGKQRQFATIVGVSFAVVAGFAGYEQGAPLLEIAWRGALTGTLLFLLVWLTLVYPAQQFRPFIYFQF